MRKTKAIIDTFGRQCPKRAMSTAFVGFSPKVGGNQLCLR